MSLASLWKKGIWPIVMFGLVALPLVVLAGDVDPTGEKLKALVDDPKYQEALKEQGGANASHDYKVECYCEIATFVGGLIWGERALLDPCAKYHDGDIVKYCLTYSKNCDHYHWHSQCLKDKGCPD